MNNLPQNATAAANGTNPPAPASSAASACGRRPNFALFHPNARGTGCAISMNLHPAHDDVDGCFMLKMMPQKTVGEFNRGAAPVFATFEKEDPICVKLDFADLTEMLQVFRGEKESVGEPGRDGEGGRGLYHRAPRFVSRIVFRHVLDVKPGYMLEIYRNTPGKPDEDRCACFCFTPAEALGLSVAIENSLGVICFGIPQVVPHDTTEYRRQVREARHATAA